MKVEEERLRADIRRWFEECDEVDAAEDELYGPDKTGDELPEELADPKRRLQKIQEAKAALEAEAKAKGKDEPEAKAQRNFTDPDSRIMVSSDKAFIQAYNCQAAVDADSQVIVVAQVSQTAPDQGQLVPLVEQVTLEQEQAPKRVSADAGYWKESDIDLLEVNDIEPFVAPKRIKHSEWRKMTAPSVIRCARPRLIDRLRTSRFVTITPTGTPAIADARYTRRSADPLKSLMERIVSRDRPRQLPARAAVVHDALAGLVAALGGILIPPGRMNPSSARIVPIGVWNRRNSGIRGGSTARRLSALSSFSCSRNSISRRPRAFIPTSVPFSVTFAPQKSSLWDCSTMGQAPVANSRLLKSRQFCASFTRRHQRIVFTRTAFQSGRASFRNGLLRIFAVIGLHSSMIRRCTSGICGKRHA